MSRAGRMALGVALVLGGCETAPYTGRSQLILLPETSELQMGQQAYAEVLQKSAVARDPVALDQLGRVGRRIAAATGRSDYQWQFTLIESREANAFCLPGGKVAVYTGILPITGDDSGLAVVLGHEIAHAIAHHGAERVSQTLLVQTGLAATELALANRDPATVKGITSLLGAGATVGVMLPWSRTQESEADHLGLIFMAKAGYDPHAAVDFWQRMMRAAGGARPPEFLSDHPSDQTRVRQIEAWIPEAMRYYRPPS
jgi:metalloendopeptidase OMA1, mitochondrial